MIIEEVYSEPLPTCTVEEIVEEEEKLVVDVAEPIRETLPEPLPLQAEVVPMKTQVMLATSQDIAKGKLQEIVEFPRIKREKIPQFIEVSFEEFERRTALKQVVKQQQRLRIVTGKQIGRAHV